MAVTVKGLRIGELNVEFEGTDGMTLKQVLTAAGIKQDGQQFIINGDTKNPVTNPAAARLADGDTVKVEARPQAGR